MHSEMGAFYLVFGPMELSAGLGYTTQSARCCPWNALWKEDLIDAAVHTLERAGQCWNAGDLAGYLQLYDEGVLLHGYAGVEPGLASVRRFYEGF